MFTKRNDLLQKEMKKLQQSEKDLMNKQSAVREKRSTEEKIISNSPSDGWVYLLRYIHKCYPCYPVGVRMVNSYVYKRS